MSGRKVKQCLVIMCIGELITKSVPFVKKMIGWHSLLSLFHQVLHKKQKKSRQNGNMKLALAHITLIFGYIYIIVVAYIGLFYRII